MGMGSLLLVPQRARLPGRNDEGAVRAERAVGLDRKQGDARTGGQEHPAAGRMHFHRGRVVALGFLLVQEFQLAAPRVARVRAHLVAVTVRRVHETLRAVDRNIGRVRDDVASLDVRPLSRGRVDPEQRDAFPPGLALRSGETPDVGKGGAGRTLAHGSLA